MKAKYQIHGLSKPNSVTLQHKGNHFWAAANFEQGVFDELFKYSKNNWDEKKYAHIEYDSVADDGTPINAVVTQVTTN
jgi:hypothetical protein